MQQVQTVFGILRMLDFINDQHYVGLCLLDQGNKNRGERGAALRPYAIELKAKVESQASEVEARKSLQKARTRCL